MAATKTASKSSAQDKRRLAAIEEQGDIVADRKGKWDTARERANESKKRYESELKTLLELTGATEEEDQPLTVLGEPGGWRKAKIADALSADLMAKFKKAAKGWRTIGQYMKFRKEHRLTEVASITGPVADRIDKAIMNFCARNAEWLDDFNQQPIK